MLARIFSDSFNSCCFSGFVVHAYIQHTPGRSIAFVFVRLFLRSKRLSNRSVRNPASCSFKVISVNSISLNVCEDKIYPMLLLKLRTHSILLFMVWLIAGTPSVRPVEIGMLFDSLVAASVNCSAQSVNNPCGIECVLVMR